MNIIIFIRKWQMFKKKYPFFFFTQTINYKSNEIVNKYDDNNLNPFVPTVPTFAVRETASLGIMGAPRVPLLNPSKTIVLSEHYRL